MKRKRSQRRPRQLSVRRVSAELSRRLEVVRRKRKLSLNQTVLDLLSSAVGLSAQSWVRRFVGAPEVETAGLEKAVADMRKVDPRDWV